MKNSKVLSVLSLASFLLGGGVHAEELLHRTSGNRYTWEGRRGAADYEPSATRALFSRDTTSDGTHGGHPLAIDPWFHLGWNLPLNEDLQAARDLMAAKSNAIEGSEGFHLEVEKVLQDSEVLKIAQVFFAQGGRMMEVGGAEGHYIGAPLSIESSWSSSEPAIAGHVIFHEFLHAFHDREDFTIWETHEPGGADHHVISHLEERYVLTHLLAAGRSPFHPKVTSLYGFLQPGRVAEFLEPGFKSNDCEAVGSMLAQLDRPELESLAVNSSVMTALSSKKYYGQNLPGYRDIWNEDRLQDLGFLGAINFHILRVALYEVSNLSREEGCVRSPLEILQTLEGRQAVRHSLVALQNGLIQTGGRRISRISRLITHLPRGW